MKLDEVLSTHADICSTAFLCYVKNRITENISVSLLIVVTDLFNAYVVVVKNYKNLPKIHNVHV